MLSARNTRGFLPFQWSSRERNALPSRVQRRDAVGSIRSKVRRNLLNFLGLMLSWGRACPPPGKASVLSKSPSDLEILLSSTRYGTLTHVTAQVQRCHRKRRHQWLTATECSKMGQWMVPRHSRPVGRSCSQLQPANHLRILDLHGWEGCVGKWYRLSISHARTNMARAQLRIGIQPRCIWGAGSVQLLQASKHCSGC